MDTVAGRTYQVKRSEFPLAIAIVPRAAGRNPATNVIVGHIREVKDGVQVAERDPDVNDDQGIISYPIAAPQSAGAADMVQTLLGFFAGTDKDDARFEITITTAGDEQARTSIRKPTFNPGTANLKFQVR
jgi:hypothetical protein